MNTNFLIIITYLISKIICILQMKIQTIQYVLIMHDKIAGRAFYNRTKSLKLFFNFLKYKHKNGVEPS
jgi:hypothetical protein